MIAAIGQLTRLLLFFWPLWLWLIAWHLGGAVMEGSVLYRAGQVGAAAAIFLPALLLASRGIGPRWMLLLAGAGAMIAGALGLAAEWQRIGPSLLAGYPLAALLPALDYPLLGISLLALAAPLGLPLWRWAFYRQSEHRTSGLLGSARFMTPSEARRLLGSGDLILGEAYDARQEKGRGGKAPLLRLNPEGHLLTVAGSGSGKSTAVAIPNALCWPDTLIAHDPKGELARLCGPARRARGRSIFLLDPLDPASDSVNVLDWLDPTSERLIDDARAMVSWLTDGKLPEGENKIFEENARELVLTLLLVVVCDPTLGPAERSLTTVRNYFFMEGLLDLLAAIAAGGDGIAFGVPARNARIFKGFGERLWGSVLGSAKDLMNCISGPTAARLVSGGTGRVLGKADIAAGTADVFVSIPVKDLDANPAIARLLLGTLLNAVYEIGKDERTRRRSLFLLDEMPRLRFMALLETARDIGRGHGITLWAIVQDLGQLEKNYGREGLISWLENSRVQSFFGIGEHSTAERISKTIGEHTVTARTRSFDHPFDIFAGKSDAPQARLLMTADEIMRMQVDARGLPDEQIILLRGRPPLRTGLAKYYRRPELLAQTATG